MKTSSSIIQRKLEFTLLLLFNFAFFKAFAKDPASPSLLKDRPMPGGGGGGGGGPALLFDGDTLLITGIEGGEVIGADGTIDAGIGMAGGGGGGGMEACIGGGCGAAE